MPFIFLHNYLHHFFFLFLIFVDRASHKVANIALFFLFELLGVSQFHIQQVKCSTMEVNTHTHIEHIFNSSRKSIFTWAYSVVCYLIFLWVFSLFFLPLLYYSNFHHFISIVVTDILPSLLVGMMTNLNYQNLKLLLILSLNNVRPVEINSTYYPPNLHRC